MTLFEIELHDWTDIISSATAVTAAIATETQKYIMAVVKRYEPVGNFVQQKVYGHNINTNYNKMRNRQNSHIFGRHIYDQKRLC